MVIWEATLLLQEELGNSYIIDPGIVMVSSFHIDNEYFLKKLWHQHSKPRANLAIHKSQNFRATLLKRG